MYLRVLLRVGQVREYAEARAHVNARGVAAVSAGIDAPVGGSEMEGTGEPAEERSCAVAGARARARGGWMENREPDVTWWPAAAKHRPVVAAAAACLAAWLMLVHCTLCLDIPFLAPSLPRIARRAESQGYLSGTRGSQIKKSPPDIDSLEANAKTS